MYCLWYKLEDTINDHMWSEIEEYDDHPIVVQYENAGEVLWMILDFLVEIYNIHKVDLMCSYRINDLKEESLDSLIEMKKENEELFSKNPNYVTKLKYYSCKYGEYEDLRCISNNLKLLISQKAIDKLIEIKHWTKRKNLVLWRNSR